MRAANHAEARNIIHSEHLKVREVVRCRGGMRYNCFTRGKKKDRRAITITVPTTHGYKDVKTTPKKVRKAK